MDTGRLVGGPMDGRVIEVNGGEVLFPVVTTEWVQRDADWLDEHGSSWFVENMDGLVEHPRTPRPPSFPRARYRWRRDGDEWIGDYLPDAEIDTNLARSASMVESMRSSTFRKTT